ncbi:enoyl-CoA hydratase-related protein [Rhodococcus sp. G-MC3]|uniref:enoyl-CoA hydratase-related protein n=1 Tax=Rhodococcus sp. G-MC3 TaxID=3046209 RepID=UPI0024BA7DAF|nr:enoyl-CoA hydratase-related protein [Rhodococcus sp. G-MC3]MDJ0395843.1 enoyl-CoA hydratase-related protein [Rhodococcus sp. G-MC3]
MSASSSPITHLSRETIVAYGYVLYEIADSVATIWHNRPEQRNAENSQLLDELNDAVVRAGADPQVRAVVFEGKGGHFSAGHDLKEVRSSGRTSPRRSGGSTSPARTWTTASTYSISRSRPSPWVDGVCVAGGFMVANVCDMIGAADTAFFADPVLHTMGVSAVEVLVHPWVLGHCKAREFLFTGDRLSAADALASGMVHRVVSVDQLDEAVATLANRVALAPPFATKVLKRSLTAPSSRYRAFTLLSTRTSTGTSSPTSTMRPVARRPTADSPSPFSATQAATSVR